MPRLALLTLLLATPSGAETAADRLHLKRAFNTEIWVEWRSVREMVVTPGFLDIYPDYPRHFTAEEIVGMQAAGFDWVRIAAEPSVLLALSGTPREAPLLAELRARVTEMQAAGLTVMLDLHTVPRGDEDFGMERVLASEANFAAYVAMAARVAGALNGLDPERTALSLFNEPVQDCDEIGADPPRPGGWPARLKRLHGAARAAAPDLPPVLSGACRGRVEGLEAVDPALVGDDNVLWSFHSDDPFLCSHHNADWTDSIIQFMAHLPWPPAVLDDEAAHRQVAEAALRAAASDAPRAAEATPEALARLIEEYRATPPEAWSAPLVRAAAWADGHGVARGRVVLDEFGALWIDGEGPSSTCPDICGSCRTSAGVPRTMASAGRSGRSPATCASPAATAPAASTPAAAPRLAGPDAEQAARAGFRPVGDRALPPFVAHENLRLSCRSSLLGRAR